MRLFWLSKIKFLGAKRGFFSISNIIKHYFWSYFDQKQVKKKIPFLTKAWVNPFGKKGFLGLWKIEFLWPKKVSFLSRTLFLVLFWPKATQEKKYLFRPKHGLTPLEKCDFWDFERLYFLRAKKGFFSIYNIIKHYF